MAQAHEGSRLKRGLPASIEDETSDLTKKPRRSLRIKSHAGDTPLKQSDLPSPLTHLESTTTELTEPTAPSNNRELTPPSQATPQSQLLSPPRHNVQSSQNWPQFSQTQPWSQSQFLQPSAYDYEVEDEETERVWGYLIAQDAEASDNLILRKRVACPSDGSKTGKDAVVGTVSKHAHAKAEEEFEEKKKCEPPSNGYLIGRHPECDRIIELPQISNRHCLFFSESKGGDVVAILEDVSTNGTYICNGENPCGKVIGRNGRHELQDGDIVALLRSPETDLLTAKYEFRYPRSRREGNGFHQQYTILSQLGKGHFATVFLCMEKSTTTRFAVKKFEKRHGPGEKSRVDGLQQEIAVLMGISQPSLLCLKGTYDEDDGVYLILELAPEGELFNWIVMKKKLTETEARKVFVQLFQAVKYLHERGIVHRDIKPENILLVDKNLTAKLADFGLAKIIGEESFTTTLCGTPSYVAPEILQPSNHRRYTRAVDVWSLGVVLYICLCGFPPFSDELYSAENPYTLAQQILHGRFDYPSPYWDSVGDPALDLIDKMLTIDPEQRYTIEECLEHPWTTAREIEPTQMSYDSTDGLAGAIAQLDFSKRKPVRERTLLSDINDVKITRVIEPTTDSQGNNVPAVKIFEKNRNKPPSSQRTNNGAASPSPSPRNGNGVNSPVARNGQKTNGTGKEPRPGDNRDPDEFMVLGGGVDQSLFGYDGESRYVSPDTEKEVQERSKRS